MLGIPMAAWIIAGLVVLATMLLAAVISSLYRKVGPNEALVIYGFRRTRIVKGGGALIFPMVENYRELSLELMSFDVAPQQDLYTRQGVAVTVEAVAQIKVKSDTESIQTAAEQFLTKTEQEREGLIRLVLEGHLRGIIGQLTVEEIVKQPEMVADRMRSTCADDMNKMGLEVISFTIKEVRDKNEYITNMGKPDVARIRRDADVATAEAERDTAIRRALAQREAAVARAQADQERVIAETASQAKQAEAQRDLQVKQAQYLEISKKQQAQADKAYDIQTQIMQQQLSYRASEGATGGARGASQGAGSRDYAPREGTDCHRAEAGRDRAAAHRDSRRGGKAALGARSRRPRVRHSRPGRSRSRIIFKKGDAEARAMNVKAEAYQEYNQAAVIDKLITGLPEVVRALAAPLANVDKITIVSTGDGNSAGMSKITGDITKMAAQVPALFETLSGMQISELLSRIPLIGDKTPRPDSPPSGDGKSTAAGK